MILSDIKQYLRERGSVCLSDIALHVNSSPDAVRGMLQTWIDKGKVRRQQIDASCGSSCGRCRPDSTEFYEWIEGGR